MKKEVKLIPLEKIFKINKTISSQLEEKELDSFIKALIKESAYRVLANSRYSYFYNSYLNQYEIVIYEKPQNEYILAFEIFKNAFLKFDISQKGWVVFVYKEGIFLYQNGNFRFYKIFDINFEIEYLDEFIAQNYGLDKFEYRYIKQDEYDKLKSLNIEKSSIKSYKISNNNALFILLIFFVFLLIVGVFLFINLKVDDIVIEDEPIVAIEEISYDTTKESNIKQKIYSKNLNELFKNLNQKGILLKNISIKKDFISLIISSTKKDNLLEFCGDYDNLKINKINYNEEEKNYMMELDFAKD